MDLQTTTEIATWNLLGITIIRVTIGLLFTRFGYLKLITERTHYLKFFIWVSKKYGNLLLWFIGLLELIGGIMITIGFYTIPIAIIFTILMFTAVIAKKLNPSVLKNDIDFYIILLAVSAALIIQGSGLLAVDYYL